MAKAMFGAGCFWGVEATFEGRQGVLATAVGYAGGDVERPTYEQVCSGRTGHAEVVQLTYDPGRVSYDDLLGVFFAAHDPTQLNRQGADIGTQYRSVIFFYDSEQERAALRARAKLEPSGHHRRPIVTEIVPAGPFWRAEDYHQRYFAKRGIASCAAP
jgi:peptide-methionine (S)-S-oxide reductase